MNDARSNKEGSSVVIVKKIDFVYSFIDLFAALLLIGMQINANIFRAEE